MAGAGCGSAIQTGEIGGRIVTGVDDGGLDVILGDRHDGGRLGGDINLAVVVGGGLLRSAALEVSNRRGDGIAHQGADILQHGHRLLAVDDVLDGSFLSILAGDIVLGHVLVSGEGIGDRASGAIIRGHNEHGALVRRLGRGQVGFRQVLGHVELPFGGHLADDLGHLFAGQRRPCPAGRRLRWSS